MDHYYIASTAFAQHSCQSKDIKMLNQKRVLISIGHNFFGVVYIII